MAAKAGCSRKRPWKVGAESIPQWPFDRRYLRNPDTHAIATECKTLWAEVERLRLDTLATCIRRPIYSLKDAK